jgi:tellurite methyltransferase
VTRNRSIEFFDAQFRRQIAADELALNPFEQRALPHLRGRVLDLGCGLGNLAVAAARQGAQVLALDASAVAIDFLAERARKEGLQIDARCADLAADAPQGQYDCVVCIGLLMFLPCETAHALLARATTAVAPGGTMVLNVLIEGTTYLEMFDPRGYCLFAPREIADAFSGWHILDDRIEEFPAPGGTIKRFRTIVAERFPRRKSGQSSGQNPTNNPEYLR